MADAVKGCERVVKWFLMDPETEMSAVGSVRAQQALFSCAVRLNTDIMRFVEKGSGHECVCVCERNIHTLNSHRLLEVNYI